MVLTPVYAVAAGAAPSALIGQPAVSDN